MKAMKTILFTAAIMSLASLTLAAGMGVSGGHDLDQLWARVQADRDLSAEDAVLLLESQQVTFGTDGTLTTRIHPRVFTG